MPMRSPISHQVHTYVPRLKVASMPMNTTEQKDEQQKMENPSCCLLLSCMCAASFVTRKAPLLACGLC